MPPGHFEPARQLGDARHVGQNLLPARPQQESSLRPSGFQQRVHRGRERTMIALAM